MDRDNFLTLKHLVDHRLNLAFYVLIILFWLAQIWAPLDTYVTRDVDSTILQTFFSSKFVIKNFTKFEGIVILLSVYMLFVFKGYYEIDNFYAGFFVVSCIVVVVSLINPNNNLEFRHYLGNSTIKKLYIYLLFLSTLTFLRKDVFTLVIVKIFYWGSVISLLKAIQSLVFFFTGNGMTMITLNRSVTILQGDTLIWMALFHCSFLGLYFDTKLKKHLIISIIYFLVMLFSFRRSCLISSIIVDMALFFYVFRVSDINFLKRLAPIFLSGVLIAIIMLNFVSTNTVRDHSFRYLGAFSYFIKYGEVGSRSEYSDSGHMLQSIITTQTFFNNIDRFWGSGLNNPDKYYVEGQSSAIHNSFMAAWSFYGLYMMIFLVYIVVLVLIKLLKMWFDLRKSQRNIVFIKTSIALGLFMFMILGWFAGNSILGFTQSLTQFVLLFSVFKIDDQMVPYLINK